MRGSSGTVGVRRLAKEHIGTQFEEPGIELATFHLPADPLYLLSQMLPMVGTKRAVMELFTLVLQ